MIDFGGHIYKIFYYHFFKSLQKNSFHFLRELSCSFWRSLCIAKRFWLPWSFWKWGLLWKSRYVVFFSTGTFRAQSFSVNGNHDWISQYWFSTGNKQVLRISVITEIFTEMRWGGHNAFSSGVNLVQFILGSSH